MSAPLRSSVLTWPRTTSTLIGPVTAMASPSMTPMASPTCWSSSRSAGAGNAGLGRAMRAGSARIVGEQSNPSAARRRARREVKLLDESNIFSLTLRCEFPLAGQRAAEIPALYYTTMATPEAVDTPERQPAEVNAHYDTRLPELRWSRRMQIPLIAGAVYSVIRLLGPTLRHEVLGWQHAER